MAERERQQAHLQEKAHLQETAYVKKNARLKEHLPEHKLSPLKSLSQTQNQAYGTNN
jgi:Tfp pilus assembly protein PilE